MEKAKKRASIILLVVVVLLAVLFGMTNFITDYMWFKEMNYVDVFFKQLVTQLKMGIPTFIILTGFVYIYLTHLKRGYFKKIESGEATDMKKLRQITVVLSIFFGAFITATVVTELWFDFLKFSNSTDFNLEDPLFGLDISFYIFRIEFLAKAVEILLGGIIGIIIVTVIYYLCLLTVRTPDVFEEEPETQQYTDEDPFSTAGQAGPQNPFEKFAQSMMGGRKPKHKKEFNESNFKQLMAIASGKIAMVGFLFFIMLGINFFLQQFTLLQAHSGVVYGAGFTGVNVTLWMYRILCVLSVLAAIMFAVHMKTKKYRKLLTIPVVMILVGAIGTGAAILVQSVFVSPNEINMEEKYLGWNINYTQMAYQLEDVSVKPFSASSKLSAQDIVDNSETINNIRVNDFDPAKQFYNQTQSIRQYYTFNDVDVDRYMINGKYTQTFLTTREIDENKLGDSWLNRHLKYTHGYGIALSRVDKVTASGQPDVLIGNIPPESEVEEITIERPEVYFGELSNEYIVVNTDEAEFDYPKGDSNSYTTYEGDAGIKMSLLNRALFAFREGSLKLLVSSNIDADSRIIINRNIMDRITSIMPGLSYEDDPYMVTVDGKLYWMVDAYTTSNKYPYAEPFDGNTNYIRNSIKVVVDAYNGDVDFYIVDETDPIAQTYSKIYPTLFKSADKMPEGLKDHIRYPNYLLQIQASVYAKYHMEDVSVFYLNEDQWDLAYQVYGTEKVQVTPEYYIAKLPGEKSAEFFNSIAFTPKSKQNMTALMVARNDGENYGELVLYQFPKSKTIYGPEQIEAQIDQNTEISKEFSLWSSSGTSYRRGNMFVIPINDSILYMEPVYLEATNSSIPEVKRIIMAYNDKIAYEETVAECLASLFGELAEDSVEGEGSDKPEDSDSGKNEDNDGSLSKDELIQKAVEAFDNAQEAQKKGDWADYGEYIAEVEKYLNQLAS